MTRERQKVRERDYVNTFFQGESGVLIEPSERPDFWVTRGAQHRIALEVTEYHPAERAARTSRIEVEDRWRNFKAALGEAQRELPELKRIDVSLVFRDPRIPRAPKHKLLAAELTKFVAQFKDQLESQEHTIRLSFADVDAIRRNRVRHDEWITYPESASPLLAEHFSQIRIHRWNFGTWFPWSYPAIMGAWPNPSSDEFGRILGKKSKKLRPLQEGGAEIWLLIVCNVGGDLSGCIFPTENADIDLLRDSVFACPDADRHFFDQIWLLSAGTGEKVNLRPDLAARRIPKPAIERMQ